MDLKPVVGIVEKHRGRRGGLISVLEEIQNKYGFLPEGALRVVAEKTGSHFTDVYGVATFYRAFHLEPRGKHLVSCCLGTACHVRGAPAVVEEFRQQLRVEPGGTTEDREITLETVNCLGACAIGPIVVVDGKYFANVRSAGVRKVIEETKNGIDSSWIGNDERVFPVVVSCPRCNHLLLDSDRLVDECPSIRVTISFGGQHGCLWLSSLYGSYTIDSEPDIPWDQVADFFCPHCHAELRSASDCAGCNAPMVVLAVRGGGMIQICSRRGCREHRLDVSRANL